MLTGGVAVTRDAIITIATDTLTRHLPDSDIPALASIVADSDAFDLDADDLPMLDADDIDTYVLSILGDNPTTAATVLTALTTHPLPGVRVGVARNPAAPVELLLNLAQDGDDNVRAATASNPHLPGSELARLAEDPQPWVRWAVAANPHTPDTVLDDLLTRHPSDRVMCDAIAHNPNATAETQMVAALTTGAS